MRFLKETFSTIKDSTNTQTAVVASALPLELVAFGSYSFYQKSLTSTAKCLVNDVKLVALSFGESFLQDKYSISSKVEEKLGEKYSSLAKAAPTIVTDIVTNIAIYGGSKLISTDLFSVKELISFSVLDVAKIAIANFIDTTPIYQEEPASNILARPKPLFNQTTSDDLVIDQEEPAISDVLPFVDQTTSVFAV